MIYLLLNIRKSPLTVRILWLILLGFFGVIIQTSAFAINLSTNSIVINESGVNNSTTFKVSLTTAPVQTVTVNLTSNNQNIVTVSPSQLTFNTADWSTSQTVTVTGVHDQQDTANLQARIRLQKQTSSQPDTEINVLVKNIDQAAVTFSSLVLTVGEPDTLKSSTTKFTVKLATKPMDIVTITFNIVSKTDSGFFRIKLSPSSLLFTTTNWNVSQEVIVEGLQDLNLNESTTKTVKALITSNDSEYQLLDLYELTIKVIDSKIRRIVPEGGVAVLELSLRSQPLSTVTWTFTSTEPREAKIATSTLSFSAMATMIFTPLSWNTTQKLSVRGEIDNVIEGDKLVDIKQKHISDDHRYNVAHEPITIKVTDVGVRVSPVVPDTVSESGTTAAFTVKLVSQPQQLVRIDLTPDIKGEISFSTVSLTSSLSLTFNSSNWNTSQRVTVTGIRDNRVDGNQTVTISLTLNTQDDLYKTFKVDPVKVNVTDVNFTVDAVSEFQTAIKGGVSAGGCSLISYNELNSSDWSIPLLLLFTLFSIVYRRS